MPRELSDSECRRRLSNPSTNGRSAESIRQGSARAQDGPAAVLRPGRIGAAAPAAPRVRGLRGRCAAPSIRRDGETRIDRSSSKPRLEARARHGRRSRRTAFAAQSRMCFVSGRTGSSQNQPSLANMASRQRSASRSAQEVARAASSVADRHATGGRTRPALTAPKITSTYSSRAFQKRSASMKSAARPVATASIADGEPLQRHSQRGLPASVGRVGAFAVPAKHAVMAAPRSALGDVRDGEQSPGAARTDDPPDRRDVEAPVRHVRARDSPAAPGTGRGTSGGGRTARRRWRSRPVRAVPSGKLGPARRGRTRSRANESASIVARRLERDRGRQRAVVEDDRDRLAAAQLHSVRAARVEVGVHRLPRREDRVADTLVGEDPQRGHVHGGLRAARSRVGRAAEPELEVAQAPADLGSAIGQRGERQDRVVVRLRRSALPRRRRSCDAAAAQIGVHRSWRGWPGRCRCQPRTPSVGPRS